MYRQSFELDSLEHLGDESELGGDGDGRSALGIGRGQSIHRSPRRSAPIVRTTYREPIRPPRFSGREDVTDYLSQYVSIADFNSWDHYERGYRLTGLLDGEAREILSGIPPEYNNDYAYLAKALEDRFSPGTSTSQFSYQLMGRVCQRNESVTEYGHRLRRLAIKAYPKMTMDTEWLIDHFIHGLPDAGMRRHVHLARAKTLADAINIAVEYEAAGEGPDSHRPERPRYKPQAELTCPVNSHQETNKVLEVLQAQTRMLGKLSEKLEQSMVISQASKDNMHDMKPQFDRNRDAYGQGLTGNRQRENIQCYNCQGWGHYSSSCPEQRRSNFFPSRNFNRGNMQNFPTQQTYNAPMQNFNSQQGHNARNYSSQQGYNAPMQNFNSQQSHGAPVQNFQQQAAKSYSVQSQNGPDNRQAMHDHSNQNTNSTSASSN